MLNVEKREKFIIREAIIPVLRNVKNWVKRNPDMDMKEKMQAFGMIFLLKRRLDKLDYQASKDLVEILSKVKATVDAGELSPQMLALIGQDESAAQILKDYGTEEIQAALRDAQPFVKGTIGQIITALKSGMSKIESERECRQSKYQ